MVSDKACINNINKCYGNQEWKSKDNTTNWQIRNEGSEEISLKERDREKNKNIIQKYTVDKINGENRMASGGVEDRVDVAQNSEGTHR